MDAVVPPCGSVAVKLTLNLVWNERKAYGPFSWRMGLPPLRYSLGFVRFHLQRKSVRVSNASEHWMKTTFAQIVHQRPTVMMRVTIRVTTHEVMKESSRTLHSDELTHRTCSILA